MGAGADPNMAGKDGVMPLAHARAKGQMEIARLIEAAGGTHRAIAPGISVVWSRTVLLARTEQEIETIRMRRAGSCFGGKGLGR